MKYIVTTVLKPVPLVEQLAVTFAEELHVPYVKRENFSLKTLQEMYQVELLIITAADGPHVHTAGGNLFFHLSMANLRIKNLQNGKHDHMITAMSLSSGMSVLDCTLGLATDAIVASYVLGEKGAIIGLEASPALALIASYGLQNFDSGDKTLDTSLRRIAVRNINCYNYLLEQPEDSYDIVYFDPMFRRPIEKSSSLKPLRYLSDNSPISSEIITEARRVARKRVVIKETQGSSEFERLGIATVVGGKYSRVHYGIIEIGE